LGLLFLPFQVWKGRTKILEACLTNKRFLTWLLLFSLFSFSLALPAALGTFQPIRDIPYFGRLRPSFAWLALASGQIGLTLLFALHRSILQWLRGFFPSDIPEQATAETTKSQRLSLAGLGIVYAGIQLLSFLQVREALWLPDSIDYIFPTSFMWSDPKVWTGTKPWGAAAFYKLIGSSPVTIDAMQVILSTVAWLSLALVFNRLVRTHWLRITAYVIILGFSLAPHVQIWNHIIQSESLSISLFVLILAIWLSLVGQWRWIKLFALIFLFGWWIGTREINVYLSLIIAGILVFVGLFYQRQRFYWGVSLVLMLFGYINMQISEVPTIPRWLYPLTNTLLNRILPDEEFFSYFEARGLDRSPELMSLSGGLAHSSDFAVFNDPALTYVEDWLYRKGKDTYIHFLLDHPFYTLTSPWQNIHALLASEEIESYKPESYQPFATWLFEETLFPSSLWLVLILALATLVSILTSRTWQDSRVFWLLLGFLTLFFPHFYLVWHGDAAEVGRHAIQASIQLRLALWLLLLLSLDKIVIPYHGIRTCHRS
jgi:hypothetical protein